MVHSVPSSGAVVVAVHELGGDDGPALLAAHGTGFHGMVWSPLADHLGGRRLLAPDLRGHGDSPIPDGVAVDWDGFADDVLATVAHLGVPRPVGIGHSKGGAALLRAEARRPGTFRALWCYEPIVFPPELATGPHDDNPLAAAARRRRATFGSREEAFANYAGKPPLDGLHPDCLAAYVDHGFVDVPGDGVTLKCRPEVEADVYRMGTAHDTFRRLGSVGCPVVIACGRATPHTPADIAPRIAGELDAGELQRFEQLGHFGPLEAPATVAASIAELVERTARPPV